VTEDVATDDNDSDSSSDLSAIAQDTNSLVGNLVSELGDAAQDADTLAITLANELGELL